MTPYVKIPRWVYRLLRQGWITRDQFDVLVFAYGTADWRTWVVSSYSAENVCLFFRVDATQANLKRYRRAEADLWHRGIVEDDYREGSKRPFHLWVLPIETEDGDSLSIPRVVPDDVPDFVPDFVGYTEDSRHGHPSTYRKLSAATAGVFVPDGVPEKAQCVSPNNQKGASPERNPLNPLRGLLPSAPQGEHSNAVGLHPKPSTRKSLTPDQCEQLKQAALLYADFSNWLYDFVPDVKDVAALLRDFTPQELLFEQVRKFTPWRSFQKNTMAHFFKKSARSLIQAERLKGTSNSQPAWFKSSDFESNSASREFFGKWKLVSDARNKVFPDEAATVAVNSDASASAKLTEATVTP